MLIIVVALAVLVGTLIIGVPVVFAFFASALSIVILGGYDPSFLLPYGMAKGESIVLCAIPMFILAGGIMEKSKIGDSLVDWVQMFVRNVKGGLGIVMAVACGLFGAISGSGNATISCIGSIMMPRMKEKGYPIGHCGAMLASCGVLGLLIPPSMNMVLYSYLTGTSVLSCFLSCLIPGIMLIILFSVLNTIMLRKNTELVDDEPIPRKDFGRVFAKNTKHALPAIFAPVIILGGIYAGLMTPTEAAAVSAVYAIPVGVWIYKNLSGRDILAAFKETAVTSGVCMFMLIAVQMLSRLYIMENVPQKLLAVLEAVSDNPNVSFMLINIILILIGMLMDDTSSFLLCAPLLAPVVGALGMSSVQFAAVMGVNLGLACVTPPCAPLLYMASRVSGANIKDMLKPTFTLILFAWIPVLIITTYIPAVSTFLPNLLLK